MGEAFVLLALLAAATVRGAAPLVLAALGVPAVQGDWRGDLQAGGGMLAAGGTTWALKELIHERRPDRSDDRSFPSGHTSVSFAAAMTMEKRYGWRVGAPNPSDVTGFTLVTACSLHDLRPSSQ